jgi:hypothetical protein
MPPQRPDLFTNSGAGSDGLLAWAERSGRPSVAGSRHGGLRFVFYGRVSTEDHQDPVTSRARRRRRRRTQRGTDVSTPVSDAKAISYLRSRQITLTYDPQSGTLQADSAEAVTTMIDRAS